ncbi:MAG TPA: NADH-quinone oxidoreductase subunit J [Anaerolineae bacterium]|nr:NADH-quinone oxidoreductase subunit J [Anaerolineae bacterium]
MAITFLHVVFLALAGFTLLCALGVVVSRNLFHSAIWLIGAFAGVAGLYWLLEAEYLAIAQIMIYIGAIATLIVFAIMLSRGMMIGRTQMNNFQAGISAVVAVLLFVLLSFVLLQVNWPVVEQAIVADPIPVIGEAFVTTYVVPFQMIAVLLSVALVGAIMIARER